MKPDIPALIILTQREHQRLNNPIKRLLTYALDEQALKMEIGVRVKINI